MTHPSTDAALYTLLVLLITMFVICICLSLRAFGTQESNNIGLNISPVSHAEVSEATTPMEEEYSPVSFAEAKADSQMEADRSQDVNKNIIAESDTCTSEWSSLPLNSCQDQLRLPLLVRHPVNDTALYFH